MNTRLGTPVLLCAVFAALITGCDGAPGRPGVSVAELRPEQVLEFPALYRQNCAGCHGTSGERGASISLANAQYLRFAGIDNIAEVTANGVPHSLMPAFSKQAGGTLTEEQIRVLAQGMVAAWGARQPAGLSTLPYRSTLQGIPADGEGVFQSSCGRCHGMDGRGLRTTKVNTGSLIDPTYLALVSDQLLRSTVVAGRPMDGMPHFGVYSGAPEKGDLTDQQVTDVVAWLASHRTSTPGQPYPEHP
jgi:cytochrome c oxidase cbb3-type subunit 3/ubiquinol-cytochrome c reductase cytochrome c subunit